MSGACPIACFLGWQLPQLDLVTLGSVCEELELESRIFESLFQRRMLKAPSVAFILLLHSKCCC